MTDLSPSRQGRLSRRLRRDRLMIPRVRDSGSEGLHLFGKPRCDEMHRALQARRVHLAAADCPPRTAAAARRRARYAMLVSTSWSNNAVLRGAPLETFDEAMGSVLPQRGRCLPHTKSLLCRARDSEQPARSSTSAPSTDCAPRHGDLLLFCVEGSGAQPPASRKRRPGVTVNAIGPRPFESKMMASTLEAFGEQIAQSPRSTDRAPR